MRVRLNITLPQDLNNYVRALAEENDLNLTTMIQLILMQYREQHVAMNAMSTCNELNSKLEALKNVNGEGVGSL